VAEHAPVLMVPTAGPFRHDPAGHVTESCRLAIGIDHDYLDRTRVMGHGRHENRGVVPWRVTATA
jgi:hypothetical protein